MGRVGPDYRYMTAWRRTRWLGCNAVLFGTEFNEFRSPKPRSYRDAIVTA
jgi:hypothetical protein